MKKLYPPNYLRTLRLSMALSQSELGLLLGVTKETVSRYERRLRLPNPPMMFAFELIFGKPAGEIFFWQHAAVEELVMENMVKLDEKTRDQTDEAALKKQELLRAMMGRFGRNPPLYDDNRA